MNEETDKYCNNPICGHPRKHHNMKADGQFCGYGTCSCEQFEPDYRSRIIELELELLDCKEMSKSSGFWEKH